MSAERSRTEGSGAKGRRSVGPGFKKSYVEEIRFRVVAVL